MYLKGGQIIGNGGAVTRAKLTTLEDSEIRACSVGQGVRGPLVVVKLGPIPGFQLTTHYTNIWGQTYSQTNFYYSSTQVTTTNNESSWIRRGLAKKK